MNKNLRYLTKARWCLLTNLMLVVLLSASSSAVAQAFTACLLASKEVNRDKQENYIDRYVKSLEDVLHMLEKQQGRKDYLSK